VWLAAGIDEVLCSLMVLLFAKSFKFGFCFANWIIGSEISFEFLGEQLEI